MKRLEQHNFKKYANVSIQLIKMICHRWVRVVKISMLSLFIIITMLYVKREFKKLRRLLQRKRHIEIELCVRFSVLRLFHIQGYVARNRRSVHSFAWHEWVSCNRREWKIYCCGFALSSETQIWKFYVVVWQTTSKTMHQNACCGYTCAAKGVDHDHERCVVALKTGCVIDGKICMFQRKIMKTVIALKQKRVFHHENIAYQNQRMLRLSRGYLTFELILKIIKFLFKDRNSWVKSSYISTSRNYFGKSTEALGRYFGK